LTYQDKLRLLKSISLLRNMSERTIQGLAEFLKPRKVPDGMVLFEEGSRGMSMYFVASGRIRIYKNTASGSTRQLAIVGPGDFFGEMSLIGEVPRSASAAASGSCVLFELYNGDLTRWVKNSAPQALQFFSELSHVLAKRLRKTSRELTLHFDLSNLLGDHRKTPLDFVREALERVLSHLDGAWSAAACLAIDGKTTVVQVASEGGYQFKNVGAGLATDKAPGGSWLDDQTFRVALNRNGMTLGSVLFRSPVSLMLAERDDVALTLTAACSPITTGLEIISLRA
jgi:CRP/FNR family transcriptional regulator